VTKKETLNPLGNRIANVSPVASYHTHWLNRSIQTVQ